MYHIIHKSAIAYLNKLKVFVIFFRCHVNAYVYFKRQSDPKKIWTKCFVRPKPERGRACEAVDIDGDGDLDVIGTGDMVGGIYGATVYSMILWENKTPQKGENPTPTSTPTPKPTDTSAP